MHISEKIKLFFRAYAAEIGVSAIIILVAFSSFYLGRMSAGSISSGEEGISVVDTPISSSTPQKANAASASLAMPKAPSVPINNSGQIVASKNGKRYYYPWCSGVSRISASNIVHYASASDAEKFGLTLAANCTAKN